jgi:hypothetical protein
MQYEIIYGAAQMSRWLIRIGVFCLVLGLLLVSPLADLMPVDLSGFIGRGPEGPAHFRVTPAEEGPGHAGVALVGIGFVLFCAGLIARRQG